jgi:UDP-glucuronate 4-epimerase
MVIHLAAMTGVRASLITPNDYWDINVNGTRAVFNWCKEHNAKCLYASSSNAIEWWTNPYATTKKVNEHDGKDFVGFRPHTVYPGREDMLYDRMINKPDSVKYINGRHERDWTHIEDVCSGLFTLIENYDIIVGKVVDIGTGESINLKEVAAKLMPYKTPEIRFENPPHERIRTCADTTILKELGWNPEHRIVLR